MIRTAKLLTIPHSATQSACPSFCAPYHGRFGSARSSVWLTKTWQFTRIRCLGAKYATLCEWLNSSLDTFSVENLKTCICRAHLSFRRGKGLQGVARERYMNINCFLGFRAAFVLKMMPCGCLCATVLEFLEYASARKLSDVRRVLSCPCIIFDFSPMIEAGGDGSGCLLVEEK